MVFAIRGSSLKVIWPRILVVTLFAIVVTYADHKLGFKSYTLTTTPFTLIGLAMAIFLGFRNNESYSRFWEGRQLWGQLVNSSRSLSRQILLFIDGNDPSLNERKKRLVKWLIAYAYALKNHLREKGNDDCKNMVADDKAHVFEKANVPNAILFELDREIQNEAKNGHINPVHQPMLEKNLVDITNAQGGCERIRNTPIPYAYSVLLHRIVAIYCLALPFGLIQSVGVMTPVVVCFISYAFFGLDAIGDEVEQPFDECENDLPLNAICRRIEIDLLQAIDAPNVPARNEPVNGVLL